MLVPAAISVPSRGGKPSLRLNQVTNSKPVAIAPSTTGSPARPSFKTSNRLKRMPTRTIPARRIVVVANLRPGASDAGSGSSVAQQQPKDDGNGNAGDGTAARQSLGGENLPSNDIGKPEPREHHHERGGDSGNVLHCPTNQNPPMTSAAADDA